MNDCVFCGKDVLLNFFNKNCEILLLDGRGFFTFLKAELFYLNVSK